MGIVSANLLFCVNVECYFSFQLRLCIPQFPNT